MRAERGRHAHERPQFNVLRLRRLQLGDRRKRGNNGKSDTLPWVDWFNHRRLLGPLGVVPPAEYEARYYEQAAVA